MPCVRCGKKLTGKQTKYCSLNCKNTQAVLEWRRRTKLRAVAYKGGKCESCGYDKNAAALLFHHPSGKVFGISHGGVTRSWNKIKAELDKCKLACLNCHAETHYPDLNL